MSFDLIFRKFDFSSIFLRFSLAYSMCFHPVFRLGVRRKIGRRRSKPERTRRSLQKILQQKPDNNT